MSALHPTLLAWPIALLVGVPVAIHLINLLRRRRVRWAAMEFLLASQKKNRRWIMFQQWLLVALRMMAVGLVIFMLAGIVLSGDWAKLFGRGAAHHVILIDDTFSMTAHGAGGSTFDRAKQATRQIVGQIARETTAQRLTLLPYGIAADQTWKPESDLLSAAVDPKTTRTNVDERLRSLEPTQRSVGPLAVLTGIEHFLAQSPAAEERTIHIVSDFRAVDWQSAPALREHFTRLAQQGVKLHLVNCTMSVGPGAVEPSVAIVDLKLLPGTRAASVPQFVEVTVKNFGGEAVRGVMAEMAFKAHVKPTAATAEKSAAASVAATSDAPSNDVSSNDDAWTNLPGVEFDPIEPGATAANRFQVRFPAAGDYELRATLAGSFLGAQDAVTTDNVRFAVASIAFDVGVLVIDGHTGGDDAFHVSSVLRPGPRTRTGLRVDIKPAAYLRDHAIDQYATVYVLDVGRLDASAVETLESFVRRGGGVVFFAGPNAHRGGVNDGLYRDGKGLFPAPIAGPVDLPFELTERSPAAARTGDEGGGASVDHRSSDIVFDRREALTRLAGEAYQGFAAHVSRYVALDPTWSASASKTPVAVLARLRNGAPLILARPFERGRVVAVLTTAGRTWSDWAGTLTFPILLQELQAYLTANQATDDTAAVGAAIEVRLDPARFAPQTKVALRTPYDTTSSWSKIERVADAVPGGYFAARFGDRDGRETGVAGVYEQQAVNKQGVAEIGRTVRNVANSESDLRTLDGRQLAEELKSLDYVYHGFAQLQEQTQRAAGVDTSPYMFWLLVALLAGEQALAYAASYHAGGTPSVSKPSAPRQEATR